MLNITELIDRPAFKISNWLGNRYDLDHISFRSGNDDSLLGRSNLFDNLVKRLLSGFFECETHGNNLHTKNLLRYHVNAILNDRLGFMPDDVPLVDRPY